MLSPEKLGIFGSPRPGHLYIVDDNIWLARAGRTSGGVRRVGTLSGWLKAVAQQVPRNSVLAGAPNHDSWIDELRFCLCRLIPYLRFLDTGDEDDISCPPELEQAVSDVVRRAALLRGRLGHSAYQPIPLDLLKKIFCVPCAVDSTQVIPLELAGTPLCSGQSSVTVRYQHCARRARPLGGVLAEIQLAIGTVPNHGSTADDAHREIAALMQEIDRLIARFEPVNIGRCQVIYYDRYHQVHYGRGHFVLVRGPVARRKANQGSHIYVGLTISGRTRKEWLVMRPRPCNLPEQLWTDAGVPVSDGMCMGNTGQYGRLISSQFTDAEAVVQWLDAGVILATGSSLFHRERRNLKLKELQQRRVRLERRQVENERRKSIHPLDLSPGDGTMLPRGRHLDRSV